jgi:hypothetical protein
MRDSFEFVESFDLPRLARLFVLATAARTACWTMKSTFELIHDDTRHIKESSALVPTQHLSFGTRRAEFTPKHA